jgi:NAD(P)H-binding
LEEVRKAGKPFKAMYRNTEDAKKAPPGAPTVRADFADKNSLQQALRGIDTAFVVCSPIPQLVELEGNMIDACKEAGVRHGVLNSAKDDKVVVRNRWTGTEAATGKKFEFSGIVMWRIAKRQLVERWAYLTPPQPAKS